MKNAGTEEGRIVIDCRSVNALFVEPSSTRPGSVRAAAAIAFPMGAKLLTNSGDLKDMDHTFLLSEWRRRYFRLEPVRVQDLPEHLRAGFEGGEWVTPDLTVPPMG